MSVGAERTRSVLVVSVSGWGGRRDSEENVRNQLTPEYIKNHAATHQPLLKREMASSGCSAFRNVKEIVVFVLQIETATV